MRIDSSNYNIFESNVVSQNGRGILFLLSYFNNATGNTITENSQEGFLLQSSSNNILHTNDLIQNEKGMSIINGSNHNLIYNNKFIGNTLNAEDNSYVVTQYSHLEDTVSPATAEYTGSFGSTPEGHWWFTDAYKDNDGRYLFLDSILVEN